MTNSPNVGIEALKQGVIGIVNAAIEDHSTTLLQMAIAGDRRELENPIHHGNFLSQMDGLLHAEYRIKLAQILPSFVYASEEGPPEVWPSSQKEIPAFVVIVDPLDTSELAVRGLCGYTHISIYSTDLHTPIVSAVFDMFHPTRLLCAFTATYR